MIVPENLAEILKALGERLRDERLRRNETQRVFAGRIGVSIPTLCKMENGDHRVQLGHWAIALEILGRAEELERLLAPQENLFEKYQRSQQPKRQRASRGGGK